MREAERADFTFFYEQFAKLAIEHYNENKNHPPMMFLVELGDVPGNPPRNVSIVNPWLIEKLHDSAESKVLLWELVRSYLRRDEPLHEALVRHIGFTPDIVVHISEAWMVRRDGFELDCIPEEQPDREEVLMINMHASNETVLGMCPIRCEGETKHAVFKPLRTAGVTFGAMSMTGDKNRQ